MLTLTLAPFDHNDDLQRIPEMHFTAAGNDYWLLLPAFEKIEEKTGKLIDLGESLSFNLQEIELIREVLSKEIETLDKEINEDALLERDAETQKNLLEKIADMLRLAALFKTEFLAKST